MRVRSLKRNLTTYFGLAATVLLLGLLFRWNLNHALTVYAFDQESPAEGTFKFFENEIEGGYITDTDPNGLVLYYQIHDREKKQVYISGYSYSSITDIREFALPKRISHPKGASDGALRETYDVIGVNGGVFKDFYLLKAVTIPDSYEWIGAEAFMNVPIEGSALNLGNGVQEIRDRAFYGTAITEVALGPNVKKLGNGVFANCPQLKSIRITGGQSFRVIDNVLYSGDGVQLIQCPANLAGGSDVNASAVGTYVINAPTRVICARAFEGCNKLSSVTISSTVTTIGEKAFEGCTNLRSIKIPNTVLTIDTDAFANCGSGLVIECDKGSAAERYANSHGIAANVMCTVNFYDGASLVKTEQVSLGSAASAPILPERSGYTLTWDKDYTNVQQNLNVYASWKQNFTVTFKDSYSGQVSQVTSYYGGSATPPSWTRQGYVLGWDSTAYTYVTKDLTINAVWLVSMTGGMIEEQKPKVGDTRIINNITYQVTRATASDPRVKAVNCTKRTLTSLTIPDTITFGGMTFKVVNIGANAFRDMPNLKKLTIGKQVTKISKKAFYNCPKLKTIKINSKKLATVGAKAFTKTHAKADVNVPNAYIKKYKRLLLDGGLSSYAKVY